MKQKAIIIGAGPAGLTAALELLERTKVVPLVLEASDGVGGISRTHVHNGNRIDLGGHRFFSKSDRVMDWWLRILPVKAETPGNVTVSYHRDQRAVEAGSGGQSDEENCMLVRNRVSRILFRGKLFDYPLSLSPRTLRNLGLWTTARAGFSYLLAQAFPVRPERSLEDFIVNRFGRHLYSIFFEEYTEKVWGVPCRDIPADWGAQRIKGVSIVRVLRHAVAKMLKGKDRSLSQKDTETSLIEHFLYPKYGPGHMWERVTERVRGLGGEVLLSTEVTGLETDEGRIIAVSARNRKTGEETRHSGDFFFSTMPVRELIASLSPAVGGAAREVSDGLMYRDFMTVGLLVRKLTIGGSVTAAELAQKLPDNWIYVQEPGVKVGRLQIFNNWSPWMVKDPGTIWLGMEYFVDEGDRLWTMQDADMTAFAISEMEKLGFLAAPDVLDSVVLRQKKAYPAYFGTYKRFDEIRAHFQRIGNLFLLGRNGQHRYNNQDHSMLTAMVAVDSIVAGHPDQEAVWAVNTEEEYHEEK